MFSSGFYSIWFYFLSQYSSSEFGGLGVPLKTGAGSGQGLALSLCVPTLRTLLLTKQACSENLLDSGSIKKQK